MLTKLRTLPENARRRIAFGVAGGICLVIFIVWIFNFSSLVSTAASSAGSTGVAIFSFLDENVNRLYEGWQSAFPKSEPDMMLAGTSTADMMATTTATSTDDIMATTTEE